MNPDPSPVGQGSSAMDQVLTLSARSFGSATVESEGSAPAKYERRSRDLGYEPSLGYDSRLGYDRRLGYDVDDDPSDCIDDGRR